MAKSIETQDELREDLKRDLLFSPPAAGQTRFDFPAEEKKFAGEVTRRLGERKSAEEAARGGVGEVTGALGGTIDELLANRLAQRGIVGEEERRTLAEELAAGGALRSTEGAGALAGQRLKEQADIAKTRGEAEIAKEQQAQIQADAERNIATARESNDLNRFLKETGIAQTARIQEEKAKLEQAFRRSIQQMRIDDANTLTLARIGNSALNAISGLTMGMLGGGGNLPTGGTGVMPIGGQPSIFSQPGA